MKTDIDLLVSLVVQLELMVFTMLFRKCVDGVYLKSECLYLPSIINVLVLLLLLLHQHAKKDSYLAAWYIDHSSFSAMHRL